MSETVVAVLALVVGIYIGIHFSTAHHEGNLS